MLIKDLPTKRLRDRAYENRQNSDARRREYKDLSSAFKWNKTPEGFEFWACCEEEWWEKARKLQPDLFKPLLGKPHVKIRETSAGGFWINQFCDGPLNLEIMLWAESINPKPLPTQGEVSRAWHNYRRDV